MTTEAWWDEGAQDVVDTPDDQLISAEEHPDFDEPVGDGPSSRGLRGPSAWGEPCQADKVVTVKVTGGVRFSVHRDIAPLVKALAEATIARGYPLKKPQCGGYNCRKIRNGNSWSNHAWGLAVDLNWSTNPMISVKKLRRDHGDPFPDSSWTDMPEWLPAMWTRYGFRWGGSYRSVRDAMHFEFMPPPSDVPSMIEKLRTDGFDAPNPPPPRLKPGATGPFVTKLQELLTAAGHEVSGPATFGPGTEAALRAFQTARGLDVDAIAGPNTWAALMAPAPDAAPEVKPPPPPPAGATTEEPPPSTTPPPVVTQRPAKPDFSQYPRLGPKASGSDVHHLQTLLTQLEFDTGGVEGNFGDLTEAAVRAFQTEHGLEVDGWVGPTTWKALLAAVEPRLKRGDSGDDVRRLQELLTAAGHEVVGPHHFGPATEAATKAFQTAMGLDVDAIAGPQTWLSLFLAA